MCYVQVNGLSGFTSKLSSFSVAGTADSRQPRDVRGRTLNVRFEIKDPAFASGNLSAGPYNAVIALRVNSTQLSSRCLQCISTLHGLSGGKYR